MSAGVQLRHVFLGMPDIEFEMQVELGRDGPARSVHGLQHVRLLRGVASVLLHALDELTLGLDQQRVHLLCITLTGI